MRYLRTNTDTRITVGPFLDKTDGITPEVALTVTSEKLTFVVDTAGVPTLILDVAPTASGGANDMVHITNDDSGFYDLELAAANVNYLGRAMLSLNDVATHLPVFHEFMIVPAVIYDAMILGTDLFDVSATQILGTAISTPATAGILDVNVKNMNNVAGTSITTINANQGTTQPINFTGTGATAYAKSDVISIGGTAQTANDNGADINDILVDTAVIGALGAGLTAIPWNASWDAEVQSEVDDGLVARNLDHLCAVTTAAADMTTEVVDGSIISRILSKTSDTSTYDPTTDSQEAIRDKETDIETDTAVIGALGAGLTALATQASVNTIDDFLDTEIAAILADTNELQTDWVNGGRLDLLIDAIKVPTDKLVFTVANQLDSNTLTQTADVHLSSNSLGDVWDHAGTITSLGVEVLLERLYEMVNNKMIVTEATGGVALRNLVDGADVATGNVADLGATTVRAGLTWV